MSNRLSSGKINHTNFRNASPFSRGWLSDWPLFLHDRPPWMDKLNPGLTFMLGILGCQAGFHRLI